jgi:microcompartment protein CcmL/EutN
MATAPVDVLGMQEFGNTAVGYFALDAIVKAAPVEILRVTTVIPAKLVVMFTGDVASVEAGLKAGGRVGEVELLDQLFIPYLHPSVSSALIGRSETIPWDAVGIVDASTVTSGVEAADRGAKEAAIDVVQIRFDDAMGGRSSVRFTGPLSEVEAAMAVMVEFLTQRDRMMRKAIIPNPHPDMFPALRTEKEVQNER